VEEWLFIVQAIFISSSLIAVFLWANDSDDFAGMRWFGFVALFGLWLLQNLLLFVIYPLIINIFPI